MSLSDDINALFDEAESQEISDEIREQFKKTYSHSPDELALVALHRMLAFNAATQKALLLLASRLDA